MCGICGKLYFDSVQSVAPELLHAMADRLAHRGPDGAGVYVEGQIGLANRRLAIVDRTPAGHQPMRSADGASVLTFNGEVYNAEELRRALEHAGQRFRSRSDTEIVLHLLDRDGLSALPKLSGMFALAHWDTRARRLILACDRHGKKPLYWTMDGARILFSSEPKSILMDPTVERAADPIALDLYLGLGYVPAPRSAFAGISKLPPGHALMVEGGTARLECWSETAVREVSREHVPRMGPYREADLGSALRSLLCEAVRLRIPDEVPFGVLLSGGLDSTTIVGLLRELGVAPIRTFSIGFEDRRFDEREAARRVARHFETEHHELVLGRDATNILPALALQFDEPFADASAVPTWHLAHLARCEVPVVLSGDGGDEALGGYDRYRALRLTERLSRAPRLARALVSGLAGLLPQSHRFSKARRLLFGLAHSPKRRYARWMTLFDAAAKARLYAPAFAARLATEPAPQPVEEAFAQGREADAVACALEADRQTYLPGDLLVKVDRASMAFGLEVRSPFLDNAVVDFCRSVPPANKVSTLAGKRLLRRAVRDLVPHATLRRRKRGFGAPIASWLRGPMRALAGDLLLAEKARARGLFDACEVERLLREHLDERSDHAAQLWALLMLELWHLSYID